MRIKSKPFMKENVREKFSIYRIAKSNLYAAIPKEFLRLIRQCAMEYKDLTLVPVDKEVEGFVLSTIKPTNFNISERQLQIIAINKLSFDTEEN